MNATTMKSERRITLCAVILALVLGGFSVTSAWAAGPGVKILDPTSKHFGLTYNDLAMSWWDWAVNQPADANPILDETGEFCAGGQDEDFGQGKHIFFLAGNFGGPDQLVRTCTVPKGKVLFFPILNSLWIVPEECDTDACRQESNVLIDNATSLECIINGVPVDDIFAYRAQSPPGGSMFEIRAGGLLESLAPDFYVPRGKLPGSTADGYWFMVDLPDNQDNHEIEFSAVVGDPDAPDFQLSIKYLLTTVDEESSHGGAAQQLR